jgi:hypothetical protein
MERLSHRRGLIQPEAASVKTLGTKETVRSPMPIRYAQDLPRDVRKIPNSEDGIFHAVVRLEFPAICPSTATIGFARELQRPSDTISQHIRENILASGDSIKVSAIRLRYRLEPQDLHQQDNKRTECNPIYDPRCCAENSRSNFHRLWHGTEKPEPGCGPIIQRRCQSGTAT